MAREIEKKYLVQGSPWTDFQGVYLRQGYICSEGKATVRIRTSDSSAWLTIKGRPAQGSFDRMEHEYSIPLADANEMLDKLSTSSIIEKTRYTLEFKGHEWVIDVFEGDNSGLVVAEIELPSEETHFDLPSWAKQDLTFDFRFSNSALSSTPWSSFRQDFINE
jgi:adenylate cyclase